ncbi:MAG TPA: glycosyltransferase family 2 protein [Gaiellaceae bacterium]
MVATTVSALVPCYGDLHLLERSLPRLLASSVDHLEVVLLNNDSTQSTGVAALVSSLADPRVRLLELEHGVGFATAVNSGITATRGELVFLANSDLFVAADYLTQMKRFFAAHPRAGVATGKVLRFDLVQGEETRILDTTGHTIGRDRGASDRGENLEDVGQYEAEEQVFGVSGAALVARRTALESVELSGEYLDESFFMYKEDVDLSWRFRLAGWECWYVPQAVAHHARTSSAPPGGMYLSGIRAFHANERAKPRHVRVHSMKNQWLMLVKNEDASNLVRHLPFIVGREALVLGYNTLFAPRVTLSALRGFVDALPQSLANRRAIKSRQIVAPGDIRKWFVARSQSSGVVRGKGSVRGPVDHG